MKPSFKIVALDVARIVRLRKSRGLSKRFLVLKNRRVNVPLEDISSTAETKRTAAGLTEHRFRAAPGDTTSNKEVCGGCLVGGWEVNGVVGWAEGKVLGALSRNVLSRRPSLGSDGREPENTPDLCRAHPPLTRRATVRDRVIVTAVNANGETRVHVRK